MRVYTHISLDKVNSLPSRGGHKVRLSVPKVYRAAFSLWSASQDERGHLAALHKELVDEDTASKVLRA
ncbi:hypothetical protein EYZ11_012679 [Aspergillus tanneri]|uniref:Uncharacterized protein n=1 Tax=Aspergillus tanneri TaxID=1220188 RepID=A0A4S3IZL6_9EURO|nr:hypothetical protein EYZ11_012679 [Aspergillus tanneri]